MAHEADELRSAKVQARAASLADQADDLASVRKALESASGTASNLWITFLSFGTFLAVTVATVTHRDLMLERAVKLPLLNVDLPLVSFFWVAPVLYLIFHAYLLLHFKVLADLVDRYVDLVMETRVPDRVVDSVREQLPSFIMVQVLAAPQKNREGLLGFLMKAALGITIALGPLILLLYMQLQFLPYHHAIVTWLHRAVIIADLALLWYFSNKLSERRDSPFAWRSWPITAASFAIISYLSIFIATFPTELHHGNRLAEFTGLREALLEGDISEVTKRRGSWFSNTLVVIDESVVPEKKEDFEAARVTRSFRGRDFVGAVLAKTDLRKADFTGAILDEVNLAGAKLAGANFGCDLNLDKRQCAQLAQADLRGADLPGAFLDRAVLDGARLDGAKLQGAYLRQAQLRGASLEQAQLQGANLSRARLDGAMLTGAGMQAATLNGAVLLGAGLDTAKLSGTLIEDTDFEAASLRYAKMRLTSGNAKVTLSLIEKLQVSEEEEYGKEEDWTSARDQWLANVPAGNVRDSIASSAERLSPNRKCLSCGKSSPTANRLRNILAAGWMIVPTEETGIQVDLRSLEDRRKDMLVELACNDPLGGLIAERMILGGTVTSPAASPDTGPDQFKTPFEELSKRDPNIAKRLLESSSCPGAAGVSAVARVMLRYWAEGDTLPIAKNPEDRNLVEHQVAAKSRE